jgi:hypothetical protein
MTDGDTPKGKEAFSVPPGAFLIPLKIPLAFLFRRCYITRVPRERDLTLLLTHENSVPQVSVI